MDDASEDSAIRDLWNKLKNIGKREKPGPEQIYPSLEPFDYTAFDSTRDFFKDAPTETKSEAWIDLVQLKSWIEACDKWHGKHCNPKSTDPVSPSWLIDTSLACLVQVGPGTKYVALSYVWGSSTCGQAQTRRDNIQQLQQNGSLLGGDIPQTIRDVILVLQKLEQRYLWIDRFCIVQDDEEGKAIHINNMASIYSNAHFTLVVAIGDGAEHGLRGIESLTPPRGTITQFNSANGGSQSQLTRLPRLESTKWYSRGWTLQEIVFSHRVLYFLEEGAHWECHCVTWTEDEPRSSTRFPSICNKKHSDILRASHFTVWPNIHLYLQLVVAYNNRSLTFDSDALPAFGGIISRLNQTFKGGFLFGLPEIFMDVALLWRPTGTCRRRQPTCFHYGGSDVPVYHAAPPSWSWAGWQADIDPYSWKSGYEYIKRTTAVAWGSCGTLNALKSDRPTSWRTLQILQWHVADQTRSQVRPVTECYKAKEGLETTPAGWSRYALPFEKKEDTYFICHSDPATYFRFPVPIPSPGETSASSNKDGSLLCCRASRALFYLDEPVEGSIVTNLSDNQNNWAGIVRVHIENLPTVKITALPPRDPAYRRIQCEFIAISAGTACNSWNEREFFEEWTSPERPRDTPLYEFYNVLWIKWENGTAYRQGIGRVLKNIWERNALEMCNVTLG